MRQALRKLMDWFRGDDPNIGHEPHHRVVEKEQRKDVHVPYTSTEDRRKEARRKWKQAWKGIPHANR